MLLTIIYLNRMMLSILEKPKTIRQIQKKIVVLGEGGVGKTTLLHRSVNNIFIDSTKMTIGTDFFIKKIERTNEQFVNQATLLLWDFAGQERFRFILKDYIRGAQGVILCFDMTRWPTLQKLYNWVEVLKEGEVWGKKNVSFILVGTKKDLVPNTPDAVSQDQIDKFRKEFNIDFKHFFKTSALDCTGVEDLFNQLADNMVELTFNS